MNDPKSGELVRRDATGESLERRPETAMAASHARATAEIQAAYTIARHNPRSWPDVRVKLLADCKRPGFADSAIYAKPQRMRNEGERKDLAIGEFYDGFLEGLSIRFAEEALRIMGNVRTGAATDYDDDLKRIFRVYTVDLESNAIVEDTVTVSKTIERSKRAVRDRAILAERINSAGEIVYVCEATDEEVRMKALAAISRTRRNLILSLVPTDIRDECYALAQATLKDRAAKDPDGERKRIEDAFAKLAIMPSDVAEYLGCPLEQATEAQLTILRGLLAGLRESAFTWPEIVGEKTASLEDAKAPQPKTNRAQQLGQEIAKKRAAEEAAKAQAATSAEPTKSKPEEPEQKKGPHTHRGEPTDGPPPDDKPAAKGGKKQEREPGLD